MRGLAGSGSQRLVRACYQTIIAIAGAAEVVNAKSEKQVLPVVAYVVVILKHGRTEFVVVGVVPLEEDQSACRVDDLSGVAARLQKASDLGRGAITVGAHIGKNLLNGFCRRRVTWFGGGQVFDGHVAQLAAAHCRLTKHGQERTVLQQ